MLLLLRLDDVSLCYNNTTQFSSGALGFQENGHTIEKHSNEDFVLFLYFVNMLQNLIVAATLFVIIFSFKISLLQYQFSLHKVCRTYAETFAQFADLQFVTQRHCFTHKLYGYL